MGIVRTGRGLRMMQTTEQRLSVLKTTTDVGDFDFYVGQLGVARFQRIGMNVRTRGGSYGT